MSARASDSDKFVLFSRIPGPVQFFDAGHRTKLRSAIGSRLRALDTDAFDQQRGGAVKYKDGEGPMHGYSQVAHSAHRASAAVVLVVTGIQLNEVAPWCSWMPDCIG
jgi:hypothetical protein